MKLYIRIKDGQPFEHPILEDNFQEAFPSIDTNNLPPEFAEFKRIDLPSLKRYEIYEGVSYEWVGSIVTDIHHIRQMSEDEKYDLQKSVKDAWVIHGFPSWVFDEENCRFKPPIPMPIDENKYKWDEPSLSWIKI